jgi:putative restriction endonuclease
MQLRLVDAAHILPVGAPESIDDVRNGLCLSPTYHRAFDNGLIFLDDQFHMRLNEERRDALQDLRVLGGVEKFCEPLGLIHLPLDRGQYPNTSLIRKANRFRRIGIKR